MILDLGKIDEEALKVAAAEVGLTIPDACVEGVLSNLKLLADHASRLGDAEDAP